MVNEPSHASVPLKVPNIQYDALIVANIQEVEYQKEYEMYLRKRLWKLFFLHQGFLFRSIQCLSSLIEHVYKRFSAFLMFKVDASLQKVHTLGAYNK